MAGRVVGLRVYAQEDTALQVCWSDLAGQLVLRAGDAVASGHGPGPGAAHLGPLPPGQRVRIETWIDGRQGPGLASATLPSPPGEELFRFATINDLHIGATRFGTVRPLREAPGTDPPHPVRCARAAIDEAVAWGARLLVAKGDLTQHGYAEEWAQVAQLLRGAGVPVLATPGNHDVDTRSIPGDALLAAAGVTYVIDGVHVHDGDGIRLVVADSTIRHHHDGRVAGHHPHLVEAAAEAPHAAFVTLHHDLMRFRNPTHWPPGVPGPESQAFQRDLIEAAPRTLVATGHSHRNRRHRLGPVVLSEVASTKDYPGVWAGYAVHEGGIRQTVFRVAAPDAIAWTEAGRRVLGGVWRYYADGLRSHRSFTWRWRDRGR